MIWWFAHLGSGSAADVPEVGQSHKWWKAWWSLLSDGTVAGQQALYHPLPKCQCQEEVILFLIRPEFSHIRSKKKKIPLSAPIKHFRGKEPRHPDPGPAVIPLVVLLGERWGFHRSQGTKFSSWIHNILIFELKISIAMSGFSPCFSGKSPAHKVIFALIMVNCSHGSA